MPSRAAAQTVMLIALGASSAAAAAAGSVSFELAQPGTASAALYRADGRLIQHVFSGKALSAGSHTVELDPLALVGAGGSSSADPLELRVVSSSIKYDWEGVIGNTGPLNGPGALKGLNPP